MYGSTLASWKDKEKSYLRIESTWEGVFKTAGLGKDKRVIISKNHKDKQISRMSSFDLFLIWDESFINLIENF